MIKREIPLFGDRREKMKLLEYEAVEELEPTGAGTIERILKSTLTPVFRASRRRWH
jgi:hypothetical protein